MAVCITIHIFQEDRIIVSFLGLADFSFLFLPSQIFRLLYHLGQRNTESIRKRISQIQTGIPNKGFNSSNHLHVHVGFLAQFFLTRFRGFPVMAKHDAE